MGRSFDGVEYSLKRSQLNLTLVAARPTRGVFQVDGWGELNANVFYGALTGQLPGKSGNGEWRLFRVGYSDYREGMVKTDNRPFAVRAADTDHIHIGTYGGHHLQTVQSAVGTMDLLAWGALQNGSWGRLAQRSVALAVEAGWQPRILPAVCPWLRGGFDYGSGDDNPNDGTHGTLFQVLPTARVYARFPFFNMMNNRDAFGELILQPSNARVGYTGRRSNGQSGMATLFEGSADYNLHAHASIGLYYGHTAGKLVVQSIYPNGKNANFG